MKFILSLALLAIVAQSGLAIPVEQEITSWEQFKEVFNKKYETAEEESLRRATFEEALRFVRENAKNPLGVTLGIHEFSDLAAAELTMNPESMTQFLKNLNSTPISPDALDLEYAALPASFDWRTQTTLNPIENQGQCGSCWAFACSFTVEAQLAYRHNTHVRLSKQELVDCSSHNYDAHYQNVGCNIGYPDSTYQYIQDHGLHVEDVYAYKGLANQQCYTSRLAQNKYKIQSHYRLAHPATDEAIMQVLHQYGPTVVVIHGTDPHFAQYKSGIIRGLLPNSATVNHVVGVVGWGTEGGVDYWIIRNSWGVGWGEQGYARIERHHNLVAFNSWVSYPIMN